MAKIEEPRRSGGDNFKTGTGLREPLATGSSQPKRHLSLGKIMLWLIYFALVSLAGRELYWTGNQLSIILLAVVVGLGICSLGFSMVLKLRRYGLLGWVVFVIGYLLISGSTMNSVTPVSKLGFNWFSYDGVKSLALQVLLNLALLIGLIGAIVSISRRRRSNDQDALLGILALSAVRQMPLAPSVLAYSTQVSGLYQIWVETLGQLLDRGIALPEAVDGLPGLFSRSSRLLIRMGTESGNLSSGLRESVDSRQIQLPMIRRILGQLVYLCWLGVAGLTISILMIIYVLPQFENIFRDFGIALPELTVSLIQVSHWFLENGWIPALVIVAFVLAVMGSLFTGGGMKIPFVDRFFGRRHSILILRSLVLFIEADQPISAAMNRLARWYPTHWVRNKLKLVAADVEQGHDWLESLQSTRLLKATDVGVLASAQRAGNLPWAIRELIATAERRWSFRLLGIMQIVFIGSLLIFGAFVLLLAVAYFSPLIALIQRLSQ